MVSVIPERTGPEVFEFVDGIPWSDVHGRPYFSGRTFRGKAGTENWFFFNIPTPVILDGVRLQVERVFLLFATEHDHVYIDLMHVSDGPGIFSSKGGVVTGDYTARAVAWENMWFPRAFGGGLYSLTWGLSLSAHVVFKSAGNILFTGAGADFWT